MGIQARSWLAMVALGLLATSSALASEGLVPDGEARLARTLDGRVAGAPVECLKGRYVVTADIFDGAAIVYRLRGSDTLYVNRPMGGARNLRGKDGLSFHQPGDLCEGSTIMSMTNNGRDRAPVYKGGVQLGPFIPYAKVD